MNMQEKFIQGLEERSQMALLEAASYYINPDSETIQGIYDIVLEALTRFKTPQFTNKEIAAYSFQALFEAGLIQKWLEWLDSQLKAKTNGNMFLSDANQGEVKKLSGGAIKGQNEARFLNRQSDGTKKLAVFGPYIDPVEICPA